MHAYNIRGCCRFVEERTCKHYTDKQTTAPTAMNGRSKDGSAVIVRSKQIFSRRVSPFLENSQAVAHPLTEKPVEGAGTYLNQGKLLMHSFPQNIPTELQEQLFSLICGCGFGWSNGWSNGYDHGHEHGYYTVQIKGGS